MKKIILALVTVATLILAASASAQSPTYAANSLTVPAVLAAGTTNLASPPILDVRKQGNVALAVTINPTTAGATNTYTFHRSVDGIYYDTTTTVAVAVASTDQTQKTTVTNLSTTGIGYLKLYSIVSVGAVTNTATKYSIKASAP